MSTAKRVICVFLLAIATETQSFIVDNCDDGDTRSMMGGWWYTYNDNNRGGNSFVLPPLHGFKMSGPGYGNKGYCAHIKGTAGDRLGWDYLGIGVNISDSSDCPNPKGVDISDYTTIRFKMKGSLSGGRLTMVLPYTESKCIDGSNSPVTLTEWADYEAPLTAKVNQEWVTVELHLRKDFHQPRWAKKSAVVSIEKVLENLKNINFHYSSPDGDSIDLWIDDIEFIK